MITPAEREELANVFTQAPLMPSKGQPMGHTREDWKYLAGVYAGSISDMKDEISRLKRKNNQLRQKIKQKEGSL